MLDGAEMAAAAEAAGDSETQVTTRSKPGRSSSARPSAKVVEKFFIDGILAMGSGRLEFR